jgi:hypothetical protein
MILLLLLKNLQNKILLHLHQMTLNHIRKVSLLLVVMVVIVYGQMKLEKLMRGTQKKVKNYKLLLIVRQVVMAMAVIIG